MNAAVLDRTEQFDAAASVEDVRRLRHQIAKTLANWGITARADDVLVACSELLTNALMYGQTPLLVVELTEHNGWLRLAVPDHNPYPPYPALTDRQDEDGRGVLLVAALSDAWGFRATSEGKQVFAEFQLGGDAPLISSDGSSSGI